MNAAASAAVRVTAGLKCAPEIGANVKISVTSTAPVSMLFATGDKFAAFSDPTRLRILHLLRAGESSAT